MSENMFEMNRRSFLLGLGAFAAFRPAFGAIDIAPKTSFTGDVKGRRIRLASVGCGGMGGAATEALVSAGCELVAVCDINPGAFDRWEKKYPGIPKFTDYRDMLKTMGDKFEVVQVDDGWQSGKSMNSAFADGKGVWNGYWKWQRAMVRRTT